MSEVIHKIPITNYSYGYAKKPLRFRGVSSQEGKQQLIDGFVNSIFLYDDRFLITFNYKGQSKTVTFEQVNSSSLTSKGSPKSRKNSQKRLFFLFLTF